MLLLVILFGLTAAVLLGFLLFVRSSLRKTRDELHLINQSVTNQQLHLVFPSAELESLVAEINDTLEQKQRAAITHQRAEKELRRQIANISHDLRTPLTSILGYIQLMERAESEDEKHEYLSIIEGRARTLQTLITSFYDLSRLEAGEYQFVIEPVDLHKLLCGQIADFYGDFTDAGFDVNIDAKEGLPAVKADAGAVVRIFGNLIQNVLRHGARSLSVRQFAQGDVIVTRFANQTDELAPEDIGRVFERFYTADKTRAGQDTGLGLAIVKSLAEQMGHTVSAELEDGVFAVEIHWSADE